MSLVSQIILGVIVFGFVWFMGMLFAVWVGSRGWAAEPPKAEPRPANDHDFRQAA